MVKKSDKKMSAAVTIIMATYNRAHFILETLRSIQQQTFSDWECLIIDDGGTDNTEEVINNILAADTRFRFFKRPEKYLKGLPGCRNFGLDIAAGKQIIFFDDDDIVHPQNLEVCFKELANEQIYFCRYLRETFVGDFHYNFDLALKYSSFHVGKKDVESLLKHELPFNSCAVMWKKECFEHNRFNETLMYAEEWELYSRILSMNFKGISVEKCLFYGRKHAESNTGEFYKKDAIRRASKAEAILLVIQNLKEKGLLSNSILRHFIVMSFGFKEFRLCSKIIHLREGTMSETVKWKIFYYLLPLRLPLYKLKKKLIKNP